MKNKLLIIILLILTLFLTSCGISLDTSGSDENDKTVVNLGILQNQIVKVAEDLEESTIGVTLKKVSQTLINNEFITSEDTESLGSGVVYKRIDNYVNDTFVNYTYYAITNRHVILGKNNDNVYNVYVYLGNVGIEIPATVLGYDKGVDLAVIKFDYDKFINPIEFADSDDVKKGEFVIAIGNPDGYEYYGSVTFGVVSGELRYISDDTDGDGINDFNASYIQHDASINPGNSGGGLFTIEGKLVGINTLKLVDEKIDNMGFSIPSNVVKSIAINYLEKGLEIKRPRLGVTTLEVKDITNAVIAANNLKELPNIFEDGRKYGLYIKGITKDGTMDSSSLEVDDIILAFDGSPLYNTNELSAKLNSLTDYKIGEVVSITFYSRSLDKIITEEVVLK